MKKLQKYAFIPLIVGLVAAVVALILRITSGQFTIAVRISIILAVIGLVLSTYLIPGRSFISSRAASKHGGNALVLTLAVIGILVIVICSFTTTMSPGTLTETKRILSPKRHWKSLTI